MRNRFSWQTDRVRPGLLFGSLIFIACLYLATFSARIETGDTLRIFDAASSVVRFGDTGRDESYWHEPSDMRSPGERYLLKLYEPGENFIVYPIALFYGVASMLPGIGLVHATWLFNVVMGVAVCAIWYVLARTLGYERKTALVGMILLGVATVLWVYSKSLFREIFVSLLLLLGMLSALRWRMSGYRSLWWLLLLVLLVPAAYYTRNSVVMALPALLLLIVPLPMGRSFTRAADGLLLLMLLALVLVAVFPDLLHQLLSLLPRRLARLDLDYLQTALVGYLLSPGGSIWGTSPVLLLALPGGVMMMRRDRRLLWVVMLLVIGYAFGHALLTGVHWFGGLSWPPRFLISVVPFVMLLTLPVLRALLEHPRWLLRALAGVLIGYSIWIQFVGVMSFQDAYSDLLPATANGLQEWQPGLLEPRYFRWVLLPQMWSSIGFDNAWLANGSPAWSMFFVCLGVLTLGIASRHSWRHRWWLTALCGLVLVIGIWAGLRWLHDHDSRYRALDPALNSVLDELARQTSGVEPLLLADTTYDRFIMNYNRLDTVRPIVLGLQPGEAISERVPARVTSDYVPDLLESYAMRGIDYLASQHERIWLLAHNSPYLTWSVRPVEHYLVNRYYPYRELTTDDPAVRLLAFVTASAPQAIDFRLPEILTDLTFGDRIRLTGVTLPRGNAYQAGDYVPVTFFWEATDTISADYVVAWFVASADGGTLVQGVDKMPVWGFEPTSGWQPDVPVLDNHALQLPRDLAAGTYHIWVLLYPPETGGTTRLPVSGAEVIDGTIGVIPIDLMITAAE